jgi:hypothetical protein
MKLNNILKEAVDKKWLDVAAGYIGSNKYKIEILQPLKALVTGETFKSIFVDLLPGVYDIYQYGRIDNIDALVINEIDSPISFIYVDIEDILKYGKSLEDLRVYVNPVTEDVLRKFKRYYKEILKNVIDHNEIEIPIDECTEEEWEEFSHDYWEEFEDAYNEALEEALGRDQDEYQEYIYNNDPARDTDVKLGKIANEINVEILGRELYQ